MSEKEKIATPRVIIIVIFFIVGVPMLPLLISGDWGWWEAWAYLAVNVVGFGLSRYMAGRKHPDLIAERGKFMQHDNTESWDKLLSPLLAVGGGLIPITAGLAARFGAGVQLSFGLRLLALLVLIGGHALGSWALIANRYFSGTVRIQSERGHHVVRGGPYRWVRHPGYAGALVTYLAIPFLLESWWIFIPVLLVLVILVIRTSLEDRTLQEKLAGYRGYAQEVRYRLIPGLW